MKFSSLSRYVALALIIVSACPSAWAQSARAMQLKEQDPQGFILTLTAVLVVFSSLLMLVFVFRGVGNFMQSLQKKHEDKPASTPKLKTNTPASGAKLSGEAMAAVGLALQAELGARNGEVAAAIGMALRAELNQAHDLESYVVTINSRRGTQWNARSQGMRQYKH